MRAESSLFAVVSAWGPSIVLLGAAVLAAVLVRVRPRSTRRDFVQRPTFGSVSWEQLSLALDDAVALCPFDAGIAGPDVYLSGMVRLTPTSYMDAVHEVSRHFSDGRSVSIDFGRLEGRQAVRLIDFSMGLAAGGSGWILRVAESVLVLTPFRR